MDTDGAAELASLLAEAGLLSLLSILREEELTCKLLCSMSNLTGSLLELGISAPEAKRLQVAVEQRRESTAWRASDQERHRLNMQQTHSPGCLVADGASRPASRSSLSTLLTTLNLDHYASILEDEAIHDIALLLSMGSSLEENLCEIGMDGASARKLTTALTKDSRYYAKLAPTLRENQDCYQHQHAASLRVTSNAPTHSEAAFDAMYINLARRPDRCADISTALARLGLHTMRFEALTGEQVPTSVVASNWDTTLNAKFDKVRTCVLSMR